MAMQAEVNEAAQQALSNLMRDPAKRELYYRALSAASREPGIKRFDLEDAIGDGPTGMTMYGSLGSIVDVLVGEGALGEELPEAVVDEDTQEEFVDMREARYRVTAMGEVVLGALAPATRFDELLVAEAEHREALVSALHFIAQGKRAKADIDAHMAEYCASVPNEKHVAALAVYPSFFTDALAKAGAIVWDGGWTITAEGRECLAVVE